MGFVSLGVLEPISSGVQRGDYFPFYKYTTMYSFCIGTFELFPVWALMNNTAIKSFVQVLWWTYACVSAVEYIYVYTGDIVAKGTVLVDDAK